MDVFKSKLNVQGSVVASIATGVLVYAVYDRSLPSTAMMHATDPNDINVEAARKKASWTAAGVVAAVSLVTRDVNVFILGGLLVIAFDVHARHANCTNPDTGKLDVTTGYQGSQTQGYGAQSGQGRLQAVS